MDVSIAKKLKNNFSAYEGFNSYYLFQTKTFNIFRIDESVFNLIKGEDQNSVQDDRDEIPNNIQTLLIQDEKIKTPGVVLEQLRQKYLNRPDSLTSLNIYLSSKCNLRCNYCYTDKSLAGTIDSIIALKAVDFYLNSLEASDKPVSINFFGGEPLLFFELIKEIVEHVKNHTKTGNRRTTFYLTTNGTLINSRIAEYFKDNNFEIVVSLDGGKAINDSSRKTPDGKGTYEDIIKNLDLLRETGFPEVRLRATITPEHTNVPAIVNELKKTGIEKTGFELMYEAAGTKKLKWDSVTLSNYENNFKNYISSISDKIQHNRISVQELSFIKPALSRIHHKVFRNTSCQMGRESITIAPDGYFYPCHWLISYKEWRIGNPVDGLDENVNRSYPPLVFDNTECSHCWARFLCGGGCPSVSYCNNGSVSIPDKTVCADRKIRWTGFLMLYTELISRNDPLLTEL